MFIVQDYVRVPGGNGGITSDRGHFYTYNHDIDHPHFAHRSGFVRMKVKNQGLVGTLGDEGKTRLTWLVNVDFGGMVPSAFVNGLVVGLMSTPLMIVDQTEEYLGERKGGNVTDLTESFPTQEEEEEGKGNGAAHESKREIAAELELKAELAEMKAEVARKDEELRKKDVALTGKVEELKRKDEELRKKDGALAGKVEELKRKDEELRKKGGELAGKVEELKIKEAKIQELRRRLPR